MSFIRKKKKTFLSLLFSKADVSEIFHSLFRVQKWQRNKNSPTYPSILTHWNSMIKFQCWASLQGLTFLEMTISQPLLKLQRASLVSYLGLDATTPPVNFLHCIRLKFVPVSNMALIQMLLIIKIRNFSYGSSILHIQARVGLGQ